MRRTILVVAGVFLLAVLAGPAQAYDQRYERSFPLHAGGSFAVSNVNGSVEVEGWEREEVQVLAVKHSKTNPPDESRVKIEVEATPNAVEVRTRYPHEDGLDVTVEYHIRVPARLTQAHVETVNGSVRLQGVESAGELRTVNGDVEVLDGAGRLSARTTNGNVRLDLASLGGDSKEPVVVETINGSVVLELSAAVDVEFEVRSLNGEFFSELPLAVQSSERAGEFRARLGRGGCTLRLRTVNGAIRIVRARSTV